MLTIGIFDGHLEAIANQEEAAIMTASSVYYVRQSLRGDILCNGKLLRLVPKPSKKPLRGLERIQWLRDNREAVYEFKREWEAIMQREREEQLSAVVQRAIDTHANVEAAVSDIIDIIKRCRLS